MVVAIIKEENDSLRQQLEKQMADQLNSIGYNAITSLQEFGPDGLSSLGEERTYLKLCNTGIDAVLTLALIDRSKKAYQKKGLNEKYPASYYYDRIWNYRKIEEENMEQGDHRYVWESILFDLSSLQPKSVLQTAGLANSSIKKQTAELPKWFISKMLKEKIIKKQERVPVLPKPF